MNVAVNGVRPCLSYKVYVHPIRAMVAAVLFIPLAQSAGAENLLLNSSFKLATNQVTPDYWDLHHAAALRFRNLYSQYNLVDNISAPVSGARVLRITNSETGFPFVYLLSKQPSPRLPAGDYVFSVYAKADRPRNLLELAPTLDRMDLKAGKTVTTEWRRYSAEFRVEDPDKVPLGPLLSFPNRGTYWISAPQLESGRSMTPYAAAIGDAALGVRTEAQRRAAEATLRAIALATEVTPTTGISAIFEFSVYTDEPQARLKISSGSNAGLGGDIVCHWPSNLSAKGPAFSSPIVLNRGQSRVIGVPIAGWGPGEYACSVGNAGRSTLVRLRIARSSASTVRIDHFRNTVQVNKSAYHLRGMMIGSYVPPEWYVSDLAWH